MDDASALAVQAFACAHCPFDGRCMARAFSCNEHAKKQINDDQSWFSGLSEFKRLEWVTKQLQLANARGPDGEKANRFVVCNSTACFQGWCTWYGISIRTAERWRAKINKGKNVLSERALIVHNNNRGETCKAYLWDNFFAFSCLVNLADGEALECIPFSEKDLHESYCKFVSADVSLCRTHTSPLW